MQSSATHKLICFALALSLSLSTKAQDIETMVSAPLLNTTGSISAGNISTFVPGDSLANSPFAMFLSGNLNFNLLGTINIPLSFAYTNKQLSKNASLPFNRFSLSPSYKWIKLYAGYTSMHFSPYSLAGHELLGGGVELSPKGGWKINALFGRMQNVASSSGDTLPVYRRMGGGLKVEYQQEKYTVGANIFKAQDIQHSLPQNNTDSLARPQDNLTGSINITLQLIKKFQVTTEYGFSAINRNIYGTNGKFRLLNTHGDMAVYHALKARAGYQDKIGSAGVSYEYVAPNYATLGAYYMTNDFENITLNMASTIKKISLAFDAGYQRNNLDKQKNSTTTRFIYSGNVSGNVSEKLNCALAFSNMQSYQYINNIYSQVTQTTQFQNLDTLNVTQLNLTASLNAGYTLQSSKEQRQGININFTYQRTAEGQQYAAYSGSNIYNTILAYQYSLVSRQFNASVSVSHNYNPMPGNVFSRAMTYGLNVSKGFFRDLKTAASTTYSNMNNEKGTLSNVLNLRLSSGYVLAKKHSLNMAVTLLNTQSPEKYRTQYQMNLSYAYSFGVRIEKKEKKFNIKGDL